MMNDLINTQLKEIVRFIFSNLRKLIDVGSKDQLLKAKNLS